MEARLPLFLLGLLGEIVPEELGCLSGFPCEAATPQSALYMLEIGFDSSPSLITPLLLLHSSFRRGLYDLHLSRRVKTVLWDFNWSWGLGLAFFLVCLVWRIFCLK